MVRRARRGAGEGDALDAAEPMLDLHGLHVVDALRQASTFLVRERARGTVSVRIITGHGTGALKDAIRQLLRDHPAVAASRPALSTDAVTLVVLNPPASAARR